MVHLNYKQASLSLKSAPDNLFPTDDIYGVKWPDFVEHHEEFEIFSDFL